DLLVGQFAEEGLDAIRFRPFNHTGPGQDERFVAPAFAAQIARIEAGKAPPAIRVGNLDAERDFLDVRDVVEAYASALLGARSIAPGTVINLASGAPRRIRDLLDALRARARAPVAVETDPTRLRPSDTPRTAGDAARARAMLDWAPRIPWETTLDDLLADWRARIGAR
ncbi:GDP-mannose 4,6-dehydratase, partial [Rubrimonas sp.]|uniref:GDP-mannose 4,6-dehydratase n=1 Tax=Rubrimonas sp. TaxID=2036015 RepID=UPI002FDDA379